LLTISEQRRQIADLLLENPSFKARLAAALAKGYGDGRESAEVETGLPPSTFPETCPYPWEQLTDQHWLPD
jgi:hypothetical protein